MTIAVKQQALWAAVETTYNTLATIAGTDVVEVENLKPNPTQALRIIERAIIRNSLAPDKHKYAGSLFGFSFDCEVKGGGTAGTAPRIGRLFLACGMKETIVASTSVTYEPESDTSLHDSLSFVYKEGPNLRKVTGCRGTVSMAAESGGRVMASFTFIGHIESEAEASAPSQTPETTTPPIFIGADVQAGATAITIGRLQVDLGNTTSPAPDPNADDGFGEVRVPARKVVGSFDPEALGISTKDFIGELRNSTEFAVQTGVLGTTAGNQVAISLPVCLYSSQAHGEREALLIYEMGFGAYPDSGDDDVAIQFT